MAKLISVVSHIHSLLEQSLSELHIFSRHMRVLRLIVFLLVVNQKRIKEEYLIRESNKMRDTISFN